MKPIFTTRKIIWKILVITQFISTNLPAQTQTFMNQNYGDLSFYQVFKNNFDNHLYLQRRITNIAPAPDYFDVAKMDTLGNIISNICFQVDSINWGLENLVTLPHNNGFIGGSQSEANPGVSYLINFDYSGTVLWAKKYSSLYDTYFSPVIVDDIANEIISIGYITGVPPLTPAPVFILKTDLSGNVIAVYSIEIPLSAGEIAAFPFQLIKKNNGNYILLTGVVNSTIMFKPVIMELSNSFSILSSKYIPNNPVSMKLLKKNDDSFYLVGSFGGFTNQDNLFVVNFDSSFNPVWSKQTNNLIAFNYSLGLSDATIRSDNSILMYANYLETSSLNELALINLDSTGSILWKKRIIYPAHAAYSGLLVDNPGDGIYLAGASNDTATVAQSTAFIIKTDVSGNYACVHDTMPLGLFNFNVVLNNQTYTLPTTVITPSPVTTTPLAGFVMLPVCSGTVSEIQSPDNFVADILLYPNPVSDHLLIRIKNDFLSHRISVFDALGRLVQSEERITDNEVIDVNVSSLAKGIYVAELNGKNESVLRKKFVKD